MVNDTINISEKVICMLSGETVHNNTIIPLEFKEGILYVGTCNGSRNRIAAELRFETGLNIEFRDVPRDEILQLIKKHYAKTGALAKANEENREFLQGSNVELVDRIINEAISRKASDIHFEVLEQELRVRLRIDGRLIEFALLSKHKSSQIISRLKIMAGLDITEKRRPQDGKIKYEYKSSKIDIRVSTLPTSFGEKVVLRLLDKSQVNLDLNSLGMNDKQLGLFRKKLDLPYGMILVTGPTGSGKTTTLYSALTEINSIDKNIMTIEDPIEYNLGGINQSHVNSEIGFSFASALRSFLRQDPDIIMLGEIRDTETAEIAIRSALTGHLVFSTLHTNDSVSCVTRLVDMGIEPFLVADSVKLVISQRLVRKLCSCKTLADESSPNFMNANGCNECNSTGYKGRTALYEMFEINDTIKELISSKKSQAEIKEYLGGIGFKTLFDSGLELVKEGITTYEEIIHETIN